MLHIVQTVKWGVAEMPQLFVDEEKAQTAFVHGTRKQWEELYSAYCDHHGVSRDCFASAQAFVNTLDVAEKSKINFWTFNPEEIGLSYSKKHDPAQKEIRHLANEIGAVETRTVDGPERTSLSFASVRQEKPERNPEEYTTPEWKNFVGTINRLCACGRNEFYLLPRDDWRQEVYSDRTALEYWDWVADNILKYKEQAQNANYSVIEDPDSSGCYRFKNQEGAESADCCASEWEAWCAAGLYSAAASRAAAG